MKQKEFYTTPKSEDILIVPSQLVCVSIPQEMEDDDLFNEDNE